MNLKVPENLEKLLTDLLQSAKADFPLKGSMSIPKEHGVYVIYTPVGEVANVGRSTRNRYR